MFSRTKIPLFRDGQFLGSRSHSTIEALFARDLVTLERNKKGYIVAAHERHIDTQQDATPRNQAQRSATVLRPTRYSYEDPAVDGRPWDLRRLNGARDGVHYAPREVRSIFLQVVMECLA